MKFKGLKEFVEIINTTLNGFCSDFQYKRKELLKMGSATNRDKLFIFSADGRDWVINPGGGTELQYHLFFRDNKIGYGLGFNTQYVPFANKKTPIEYIQPFANGFLSNIELQKRLFIDGFVYLHGDRSQLENLIHDNYVLIGKEGNVNEINNGFEINDDFFDQMIEDLKGILYKTYIEILNNMNSQTKLNKKVDHFVNILMQKKQIILQGPPGTGKTYTAKDIAEQIITGNVSNDKKEQGKYLKNSDQFELVQFHPSYTYEDFVRGIAVKSDDGKIKYETENKVFGGLIQRANEGERRAKIKNNLINIIKDYGEELQVKIDDKKEVLLSNSSRPLKGFNGESFKYTTLSNEKEIARYIKVSEVVQCMLAKVDNASEVNEVLGTKTHGGYLKALIDLIKESSEESIDDLINQVNTYTYDIKKKYVLIVDEINRANLPSVLGELIYALEYRDESVTSIYEVEDHGKSIIIPDNLFIIGTMNTADRSVGHIDYAIRRRFAFVDVLPNPEIIKNEKAKKLFELVSELFTETYLASDFEAKEVQLGHSYFLLNEESELPDFEKLKFKLDYEILPILNEYVKDGLLLESAKEKINEIESFEC